MHKVKPEKVVEKPQKTEAPKQYTNWYPFLIIASTFGIYYLASRYIGGILALLYPMFAGWDSAQITAWTRTNAGMFWIITFIYASMIGLVWGALKLFGTNLKAIGLKKPRWMDISYALTGFAAYFILYVIISAIARQLFPGINFEQRQDIGFTVTNETSQLVLVFLSLVIAPPLAEEILCRGFLYTGLRKKWPVWIATIITSLMFAVAHLQFGNGAPLLWVAAIDTFVLSLVLVFLREKTNSLSSPILLHMLKNGLAFTLLFVIGVR